MLVLQLNPVKRVKGERHYLIKIAIAGVFTLYMEGGQYLSEIACRATAHGCWVLFL